MKEYLTEEYLTPRQAADHKGVPTSTIYKAIARGSLPAVRVLGRMALRVADVAAYQPGSYGGATRIAKRRGPGRRKRQDGKERPDERQAISA